MPKIKYSKEIIIEKALELAELEGFQNISVRKVASAVGCSTAPIYTAFENVANLIEETKKLAIKKVLMTTSKKYTPNLFLNIGVGLLVFARDHKNLYSELFILNPENIFKDSLKEKYLNQMKSSKLSKLFSEEELEKILIKMWIFTHGLCALICANKLRDTSTKFFIDAQGEVGSEIIFARLYKNGKLKIVEKEMERRGEKFENFDIEWMLQ